MTDIAKSDEASPVMTVSLVILSMIALTFVDRTLAKVELSTNTLTPSASTRRASGCMREASKRGGGGTVPLRHLRRAGQRNYRLALGVAAGSGQADPKIPRRLEFSARKISRVGGSESHFSPRVDK